MKSINNLRAALIYEHYKSANCSIVVTDIMKKYLGMCPSLGETGICKQKGCMSKKYEKTIEILSINNDKFDDNFANLEEALSENFPKENFCSKCRKPYEEFSRKYGHHIFIEVH